MRKTTDSDRGLIRTEKPVGILPQRGKSLNVIADAIAFKHDLVPPSGPNFDDPIGESPFGHFSSGCRKKRGTERKI